MPSTVPERVSPAAWPRHREGNARWLSIASTNGAMTVCRRLQAFPVHTGYSKLDSEDHAFKFRCSCRQSGSVRDLRSRPPCACAFSPLTTRGVPGREGGSTALRSGIVGRALSDRQSWGYMKTDQDLKGSGPATRSDPGGHVDRRVMVVTCLLLAGSPQGAEAQSTMVPWLTRNADNSRSGWNSRETILTPDLLT